MSGRAEDRPGAKAQATQVGSALSELMAPLNAIIGFAALLADYGDDLPADKRRRYAAHVRDGGEALRSVLARFRPLLESSPIAVAGAPSESSSGTFEVARRGPPAMHPPSEDPGPMPAAGTEGRPVILVVDSDSKSGELTSAYLAGRGYDLVMASSGEQALALAVARRPDLVLLDTRITNVDGFETARRLKALASDEYLPIVFVTALADDDSRLRALEAGAEQFLAKPVNRHELRARVRNLLNIRAQQRALAAQNAQLRSLQRFKDETTAMLVHDLKSPLSAMTMNLDFALGELPAPCDVTRGALEDCRMAGARLFRMIANLLDIARGEEGRLVPRPESVDLGELLERILRSHAVEASARNVHLTSSISLGEHAVLDQDLVGRVVENLLENALRYTSSGGNVRLEASLVAGALELRVANDGPVIAPESRSLIFEKYAQASQAAATRGMNRGLGLYFCRIAVEAHGGQITLEQLPDLPTCFRIVLPQPAKGQAAIP
jgi:two-component system sensor histidine kinase/response regulator